MLKNTIECAIEGLNWEKSFENKSVYSQVCILNETTLNIFLNFIPKKIITCNDKDRLWFNNKIRYLLIKKKEMFRQYINNGKLHSEYDRLQFGSTTLRDWLKSLKEKHNIQLSIKLNNQSISSKT